MADGPLTVYEFERLHRPPHHVVLAVCEAGRAHLVTRDEVWGLAAALLGQGTASLIAPIISIFDEATVGFMRDYDARLQAGGSPAEALAVSQERALRQDPAEWAAPAPFVYLGDGLSSWSGSPMTPAWRPRRSMRFVRKRCIPARTADSRGGDRPDVVLGQVVPAQSATISLPTVSGAVSVCEADDVGAFFFERPVADGIRLTCTTATSGLRTTWISMRTNEP